MDTPLFTASVTVCVERNGRQFFRSANVSSAISVDDAKTKARTEAQQRAERAANGEGPLSERGEYPYPERTLVEPVLERVMHANGELARVTRNSYEASVLNAYRVMFVDVDTEVAKGVNPRTGQRMEKPPETIVSKEQAIALLGELIQGREDLAFRIYQTRAGFRYLCTSKLFDPLSEESAEIMRKLSADKRYATLCRVQKCYRARLTPKPWRCELKVEKAGGFFARLFSSGVVSDPEKFATCNFVRSVGRSSALLPEVETIVELHDRFTKAASELPLA